LNNLLLRQLFKEPDAFEIVSFSQMTDAPKAYQVKHEEIN